MIYKKIFIILSGPIKKFLFWRVSRIQIGQKASGAAQDRQKKIHIVRLDAIGDFVLFSAILPYFRKIYPRHKIVLIVDKVVEELALWLNQERVLGAEPAGYFDELIAIDGKLYNRNFFYYYWTLKNIRLSAPEFVVQPTFSRTTKSDEIVLISKEAKKIGYHGDISNIDMANKIKNDAEYDCLIQNPVSLLEPDNNKHFLNELARFKMAPSGIPKWLISKNLLAQAKNQLALWRLDLAKPLVAMCPGSSRNTKSWPPEKFVSLILKLHAFKPSLQFMLIGGNRDTDVCLQISGNENIKGLPVFNLCGKTKLSMLSTILSLARLYIGNNTGSLHISCAVGICTIALDGKEHYLRFFPYPAWKEGSNNISITNEKGPTLSVKDIDVEKVYGSAIQFL